MGINYAEINKRALNSILATKKHISLLAPDLKALIELRVSQLNGCAYCLDLHSKEARRAGVSQQRLDCLIAAKESELFSAREVAALDWAERVTNLQSDSHLDENLENLTEYFNEEEIVDLTLVIALMNCLNRMAISMGSKPEAAG